MPNQGLNPILQQNPQRLQEEEYQGARLSAGNTHGEIGAVVNQAGD